MADRPEYVLDTTRVFLLPFRQHGLNVLPLHIGLGAAQVTGNDREIPGRRVVDNVFLAAIRQRSDHHVLAIIRQQLGRHGLDAAAIEQVQEQGFDDVIAMMSQRDPRYSIVAGKIVQRAASHARAQTAGRAPLRNDAFHHAVGVLLDYVEWNIEPGGILGKNVFREIGLFLIQVHGEQLKMDRRPFLQGKQHVQQGVGIFTTGKTDHDPVTFTDHIKISDGATGVALQALHHLMIRVALMFRWVHGFDLQEIHGILRENVAPAGQPSKCLEISLKTEARRRELYYSSDVTLNANNPSEILNLIAELKEEHRDLDEAITRLVEVPSVDQLRLRRLKKRKLKLKDWLAYLESKLIPDLDA